jgi:hypothetical protein
MGLAMTGVDGFRGFVFHFAWNDEHFVIANRYPGEAIPGLLPPGNLPRNDRRGWIPGLRFPLRPE